MKVTLSVKKLSTEKLYSLHKVAKDVEDITLQDLEEEYLVDQINDSVFEVGTKPETPSVEIVCFHGLQLEDSKQSSRQAYAPWLSREGSDLWLNWIIEKIPESRILVVTYDASARKTQVEGNMDMYLICENLLHDLTRGGPAAVGKAGCPIVLVGHCFGGLVMKELCVIADQSIHDHEDYKRFMMNVRAFLCYASLHHGSELLDHDSFGVSQFQKGPLFKDCVPLDPSRARRNEKFRKLRERNGWKVVGVGEGLPVTLRSFQGYVVTEASSRHDVDEYYTVADADHFTVSRPTSRISPSYYLLKQLVCEVLKQDAVIAVATVGRLLTQRLDVFKDVKIMSRNVGKLLELLENLQPDVAMLNSSSQQEHLQYGGKWWSELEKQLEGSRDLAVASCNAHYWDFWATVRMSRESVKLYAGIYELMLQAPLPQVFEVCRQLEVKHATLAEMKALQDKLDKREAHLVSLDEFDAKNFMQSLAEANAEAFDSNWSSSSAYQSNVSEPDVVFGGGAVAKELKHHLLSENCPKWAGLLGMGGIGKTFTARSVYCDFEIEKHFVGGTYWVTVSKDYSDPVYLFRLLLHCLQSSHQFPDKEIQSLLKKLEDSERSYQLPLIVDRLKSKVKSMLDHRRGRMLLVLDDVWRHDALNCFDVFSENKKVVILITTRLESVLTCVRKPFKVPTLFGKDSWQLFKWHAFGGQKIPENVKDIAKQVAERCGGLPLALEVIGAAMANMTVLPSEEILGITIRQKWQNTLDNLVKHTDGLYNMLYTNHQDADAPYDKLYNTLQLSIEDLPQQQDFPLRDCFFTFAAFPEDWEIETEELLRMWMAEGLVQNDEDTLFSSEAKAKFLLAYLAGRSMIELMGSGKLCKIHDVMRHLIQLNLEGKYCAGTSRGTSKDFARECFYFSGLHLSRFPRQCCIPNGAHAKRISLHSNQIEQLPSRESFNSPDLQVLIMSHNKDLDLSFHPFFQNLSNLRMLILRSINTHQLCGELFSELKSLVLLDLTGCASLEHISDAINGSHNLEYLSLKGCKQLRQLPPLGNLSKLKYFSARFYEEAFTLPPNLQYLDIALDDDRSTIETVQVIKRNAAVCSLASTFKYLEQLSLRFVPYPSEDCPNPWEKCESFSSLKSFRIRGYDVADGDIRQHDTMSSRNIIWRFGPMMMPNLEKLYIDIWDEIPHSNLQSQFLKSIEHLHRLKYLKIVTGAMYEIYHTLEYLFTPSESLPDLEVFELFTHKREVTDWHQFPPIMLERERAGNFKIVYSYENGNLFSPSSIRKLKQIPGVSIVQGYRSRRGN